MLEHAYVTEALKIVVERNAYGDFSDDGGATLYHCRFREETQQVTNNKMEEVTTDAMAHFPPTVPIEENDVFKINGLYYRVIKKRDCRRLGENTIQFIKVMFLKIRPVVS